jgi:hypothetical protein
MTNDSQPTRPTLWDWMSLWKEGWPHAFGIAAPQNLVQPLFPGAMFGIVTNVTEQNSSSPDTEREIVAAQSYGRQLGRVSNALAAVIEGLPKEKQKEKPFEEFAEMRHDIDAIKLAAATRRLDRIAADLATMKAAKPEAYQQMAAKLREALG